MSTPHDPWIEYRRDGHSLRRRSYRAVLGASAILPRPKQLGWARQNHRYAAILATVLAIFLVRSAVFAAVLLAVLIAFLAA